MTETEPGMPSVDARRGAANFAPILMILSFVLMVAFLAWLGLTAEGTEQVAMAEDEPAETADSLELAATPVTPAELGADSETYEGQTIRLEAPVASAVGSEAFFLELPQSPFLVKMDSAMVAAGRTVPDGDVAVTGTVMAMNDSIVTAWADAGVIGAADRPLVEFATHFIHATRVRVTSPPEGGGGQGQGGKAGGQEGQAGGQGG